MRQTACLSATLALAVAGAGDCGVTVETARLAGIEIRLFRQPFLEADEIGLLHRAMTEEAALASIMTPDVRYAVIAAAPGEGFHRNGEPVASSFIFVGEITMEDTRSFALEGCEARRTTAQPCVVIMEFERR